MAEQSVVHHILLFGCNKPFQMPTADGVAWDCMSQPTCQDGGTHIIYGWGRNAPHLELPPGVGYSVGEGTTIRYIVAQVHFLGARPPGDRSGVQLTLHSHATSYAAGLMAYAASFVIPPNTRSTLVDDECCYQGHQQLTTFAFRVHTHVLGRSVTMTRELWNHTGREVVATNNPQLPQAFYPVKQQVIWPGDRLKVTCDFDSTSRSTPTYAGSTHNDEMCNMYMMVYGHHPIISMCDGDSFQVGEDTPGVLPRAASFAPDPCPFWQPPPGSGPLGDATGVALAGDGSVWALYRGSRHWQGDTYDEATHKMRDSANIREPVIARLDDQTGAVLSTLGAGMFSLPHMITVDREGALWVVDVGAHQVVKLGQDGKVLLRVGEAHVPGSTPSRFCQPTQVAVARDGSFFVSDGYCNSRVAWFDTAGKFIADAPVPRTPDGHPSVAHSVLLDECRSKVYVAARETGRVYEYAYDAAARSLVQKNVHDLSQWGRVWSLVMGPYGLVLALTWESGKDARLVNLVFRDQHWVLPGLASSYPHDIALGPAPTALSGASDRLFALYVAPTCSPPGCGPLRRFVLRPHGFKFPNASALVVSYDHDTPATDAGHKSTQAATTHTTTPAAAGGPRARGPAPSTSTSRPASSKTPSTSTPSAAHGGHTQGSSRAGSAAGAPGAAAAAGQQPAGGPAVGGAGAGKAQPQAGGGDEAATGPYDMWGDSGDANDVDPGVRYGLVVGPRMAGLSAGKVAGLLALAACMVGAAVVVGLRAVRTLYPGWEVPGASNAGSKPHASTMAGLMSRLGLGQGYARVPQQQAAPPSIDDMLAHSAALEG
eukprot:CAMPEP_0202860488 /NCGR_PEP_ID=MMETSP1391-20130828/2163_1 /ASSEMBLY_ACC=CAM_ASM_000867 /TAXON_ID=1034604 /ORGANISM="Chlamydomonas leiostraca, Strain SAG 11-49" /LENGTH=823 /DNA_ID=CAMNT_0049539651 /DNA_START=226 /DNA_END=2694 /DNA_ORIENTATION=+